MEIIEKIGKTVREHSMLSAGDHVIAGLSGGADSVCLLRALYELSEELKISLSAVHVNHCLRGDESDRDEDFCRRLCGSLGIELSVYRVDVMGECSRSGSSVETAARQLRYECFEKEQEKYPLSKIATAHNKCDSSETVIFNITRGTGIKGICGIPYVRGSIIRPLLDCERSEIEAFLDSVSGDYVTDSSNLADEYSRNKIRHRVIPQLISINSGFYEAVSRLSLSAREDEEYFNAILMNIPAENIADQPAALRKRYIAGILSENNIECSFERLCELDSILSMRKNSRVDLSGDIFAVFKNGIMTVEKQVKHTCPNVSVPVDLSRDSEIIFPEFDKIVKIKRINNDNFRDSANIHKNLTNNFVNYVKIQDGAVVRNKHDGDSIVLKGRSFHTKLKKLYNMMKVPPEDRLTALVMEDSEGIFWSEYGGAGERVSPGNDMMNEDIFEITVIRR